MSSPEHNSLSDDSLSPESSPSLNQGVIGVKERLERLLEMGGGECLIQIESKTSNYWQILFVLTC